jgi:hypothetical protein
MKKPVVWIGVLFLALVLGVIVYSSMTLAEFRVEVCMEYQGRTSCRKASGKTETDTLRAAINNACGDIASGVTDTISCQNTQPKSMIWLERSKQ